MGSGLERVCKILPKPITSTSSCQPNQLPGGSFRRNSSLRLIGLAGRFRSHDPGWACTCAGVTSSLTNENWHDTWPISLYTGARKVEVHVPYRVQRKLKIVFGRREVAFLFCGKIQPPGKIFIFNSALSTFHSVLDAAISLINQGWKFQYCYPSRFLIGLVPT